MAHKRTTRRIVLLVTCLVVSSLSITLLLHQASGEAAGP